MICNGKRFDFTSLGVTRVLAVLVLVLTWITLALAGPSLRTSRAFVEPTPPGFAPPEPTRYEPDSTFPVGSYQAAGGDLVLTFSSDGKFSVKRSDGAAIAAGTYTIDGDQMVLSESLDGGDGNRICEETGKYKWKFDGQALFFSKVEDECEGRARALTSGPCPMLKKGEK
jgi:hypothetical protein